MCQFIVCDCLWCNWCGTLAGIHNAACIYSYWLCKPADLASIDPDCCHICELDGWGGNFCCWGNICCAPMSVKQWSKINIFETDPLKQKLNPNSQNDL